MITTITGNNSLEMRRRLNMLVAEFEKEYGELAVERIEADEVELGAILDSVQSLPFLSPAKLVVIKNLGSNKPATENIEQIISSVNTPVSAVIFEPNPDKRTAFYKILKTQTDFLEFSELDTRALPKWVADYTKEQAGKISLSDANYLVERLGANQQLIASELDKLITYDGQISRQSIDLLTEKTPQSKVFDLLDAAFAGHKNRALNLYAEQRAQKVEPPEILAMLAWQLRLMVYAKLGQGKTSEQIASDISASPYPVTKAQRLVDQIDQEKLTQMVEQTAELDKKSKTSAIDLDEALKTYIISVL